MIFGGFEFKDQSTFLYGLLLYFFVAVSTGVLLGIERYVLKIFSLQCIQKLSSPAESEYLIGPTKQLGDRIIDDGQVYYYDSLHKAGDLLQNVLRCLYFSYLTAVLVRQNHLEGFTLVILVSFLMSLLSSVLLFVLSSRHLKFLRVYYEKNLSQFRSYLNFGSFESSKRHNILSSKYYSSGENLAFYESISVCVSSLISYFPYFFPLIVFSSSIFKGELCINQYVRIAGAISTVLHSLIWFSNNIQVLSEVRAARARISRILC